MACRAVRESESPIHGTAELGWRTAPSAVPPRGTAGRCRQRRSAADPGDAVAQRGQFHPRNTAARCSTAAAAQCRHQCRAAGTAT